MKRWHHVLAVGATGMLAGTVSSLVGEANQITLLARRPQSLAQSLQQAGGHVTGMAVDYHDSVALRHTLQDAQARFGPVDLALCWIHSSAAAALEVIAGELDASADLVQVVGSADEDVEARAARLTAALHGYPLHSHRIVILGYMKDINGSRWLSHAEISAGVLAAIRGTEPISVVGQLQPWNDRP
jgi:hypothetical protein